MGAALLPLLAGCSLLQTTGTETALTGIAACAFGHTWTTDLEDAAAQVKATLESDGVVVTSVTATGTQTLEWGIEGRVVLTPDYTVTVVTAPAADQVLTITETHAGSATGAIYVNGEVGIPRKWEGTGVSVDVVADNNGVVVEEPPFAIPATSFDDSVGLELTCSADKLTIHPRTTQVIQTWKRSA